MSELTKLLEGVKVEWKSLQDLVTVISAPSKVKKEVYRKNGKVPIIDQGIAYIAGYTDDLYATVKADKYIIFGDHSEHIKYIDFSFVQGADGLKILKAKKDYAKYLYYSFINFYKKELSYKRHWTNAKETLIPIPCPDNPEKSLKIQEEIVRILDRLSEETNQLNAALQKELVLHQKRYDFYREELFKFEGKEVVWKSLGEVYKFQYGKGNTIPTNGGEYPVYGSNGIVGTHTDYNSEDAPVIGHIGAYAGIVNWASGKHFVTYNGVICKLITGDVIPRYGYYQLLKQDFNSLSKNSSQPFVSYKELNSVIIPIPTVEIQQEIVRVLDNLTEEINQLTKALQKEIALRNKQYEYYRDRFLSFQSLQTEAEAIH